jgi:hypothetical protein
MSDMEDFSAYRAEENAAEAGGADSMAVLPEGAAHNLKEIEKSLDGQSYFLGEVPQLHLLDPRAYLPLNSDRLVGSQNVLEMHLNEIVQRVEEEVTQIQKIQRKINGWEERIEKNKGSIRKNQDKINQNNTDIIYDKKNRDYWLSRSEEVSLDYQHAAATNRKNDWEWLIKKFGLKNSNGTSIDPTAEAVEELCNGAVNNLIGQYRATGNKYEQTKKDRETENVRLARENGAHLSMNDTLQSYISHSYSHEVEPLQDGVLLIKELGVKLKALSQQEQKATYGELRAWAEHFLSDFLKSNPRTPQSMVNEFRRLTSIPLPADHS